MDAALDTVKYTVDKVSSAAAANSCSEAHQATFIVIDDDQATKKKKRSNVKDLVINDIDVLKEDPIPGWKWSICRNPMAIDDVDERAHSYSRPRMVSIGPIHYKKSGTELMESQKLRFLRRLLERYSEPDSMVKAIEDAMRGLELRTRGCYSEQFPHIDSESFTTMMLLDGCFQIELFRLSEKQYQGKLADDPIFETKWMPIYLGRDMLMLENQLPLFVLQELFELTRQSSDEQASLNELVLHFFESLRPGKDVTEIEKVDNIAIKPHILALFHSSFSPSSDSYSPEIKRVNKYNTYYGKCWFYNAKLLKNCGVKFRKKSGNILDIEFQKKEHAFNIPTLFIDESAKIVLRNLIAYEESDRRVAPYFTSLILFFSNLLHGPIDAEVLMQAGIIRQTQNSSTEVVDLFCNLANDLLGFDMDNCYLHQLFDVVNTYTNSRWARTRAFVKQNKLRLSFGDFVVIFLTFVLSFLAVRSPSTVYVSPPIPSGSSHNVTSNI